MADKKISALPAATIPLAGTEVLPIVQGGVTDQVSVANLTAGRDVAVKKLNPTDNVVIAAGKGIDFSANAHAAGMTSELLNDYEEGTWTPELSFGGGSTGITYSVQAGSYTKIGNRVLVTANLALTNKGSSTGIVRISTPYPVANNNNANGGLALGFVQNITFTGQMYMESFLGTSEFRLGYFTEAGGNAPVMDTNFANNSIIMFSGSYYTA